MKTPSHPPSSDKGKPLTARRRKILELAMAQLKKTRAQMDPTVLGKIRDIIANNPKVMKGLGLDKMPKEAVVQKAVRPPTKGLRKEDIKEMLKGEGKGALPQEEKPQEEKPQEEKIDQAHNMEVMAKLMQLKPNEVENIKAVLLKEKD